MVASKVNCKRKAGLPSNKVKALFAYRWERGSPKNTKFLTATPYVAYMALKHLNLPSSQ